MTKASVVVVFVSTQNQNWENSRQDFFKKRKKSEHQLPAFPAFGTA